MKILLIIASVLVLIFVFITSIAPFKDDLLSGLFPKNFSRAASNPTLSLLPSVIAGPGQTFMTPVMLDTAGNDIVGVDIMLFVDKSVLELTDVTTFPQYSTLKEYLPSVPNVISTANNTGYINFSAITSNPEDVFNGALSESTPLAFLHFKVLKGTPTLVSFIHTITSTTDSNLTGTNQTDILVDTINLSVNNPPITYPETSTNPNQKPGDIDNNGKIDIFDYNSLLTDFGKTGNLPTDLDKDGKVGIFDYNILLTNFGK